MKETEPVILGAIAKVIAAALVALVAKYGLALDTTQVAATLVTAELAIAAWVRSRVSPVKA